MKIAKATKILEKIFNELAGQLTKIQFESSFVTSEFVNSIQQLKKNIVRAKKLKKDKNLPSSVIGLWVALPIVDLTSPDQKWFCIGKEKAEEDELLATLVSNLNTQHQWLLVEAFEVLEKYIKDIWGALGYLDKSLWQCSDFGDITPSEIGGMNLQWHMTQVRKTTAKHNTKKIREHLRNRIAGISEYESSNNRGYDYSFIIGCIEALRHIIVHSSGEMSLQYLYDTVGKHTGKSLEGNKEGPTSLRRFVDKFTEAQRSASKAEIMLINKENIKKPFQQVNNPLLSLLGHLGCYGALLYTKSIEHFGHQPFWKRDSTEQTH
jgi:hypothetical protein